MGEVKLKIMRIVFLVTALGMFIGLCGPKAALADVTLSDPSLPPLTGHWTQSPSDAYARYAGNLVAHGKALEGEIHLRRISLREFHNISRTTDGADEIIDFDGTVEGNVFYMKFVLGIHTAEDNSSMTFNDMAHMRIRVKGKAGKTSGTYPLELESLFISLPARDAAGNKLDVVFVRNVQSRNSTGSITITDLGGGSYQMNGYLDAYTEGAMPTLSASEYFQDQNSPVHLLLQSFTSDSADLSVTQSASSPAYAGGTLTYTITVANSNYTSARDVILADALPAGATLVSVSTSTPFGYGCALTDGNLVCNLGSIFGGSPVTIKAIVTLPTATGVMNRVHVASLNPDPNLANNVSTLLTTVSSTSSSADLAVMQVASPNPGVKSSNLTYTVTASNNGHSAADATISDILPDAYYATYVSAVPSQGSCAPSGDKTAVTCTLGAINVGGSASVAITVQPKTPFKLTNTVMVTSPLPDPNRGNNSSTLETKVSPTDLRVTQSVTPERVTLGSNLSYTITVNNNGPEAVEDMNIVDIIPDTVNIVSLTPADICDWGPEKIYCRFLDMAAGGSATVTLVVTPTVAGNLTNSVELVSSTPNVNPANNFSSVSTEVITASKVKVLVPGQPSQHRDTLAAAYTAAPTGATIQARSLTFPEELTFDAEKTLSLKGGYDAGFNLSDGATTLDGTLVIGRGTLTVERFIVQ